MVRSISWKILPGSFGKMDKIASARNAISETPYDFLPKVQRQQFILDGLIKNSLNVWNAKTAKPAN